MAEGFVTHEQLAELLAAHDSRVTTAFETVERLEEKVSKNVKWLIGIIVTVLIAYGSAKALSESSADEEQRAIDARQDKIIIETLTNLGEAATLIRANSESTSRRIDSTNKQLEKVEERASKRIDEIERRQIDHLENNGR